MTRRSTSASRLRTSFSMPISFSTYIFQISEALEQEDGPKLAYLLRPTSPQSKDLLREFRNPTVSLACHIAVIQTYRQRCLVWKLGVLPKHYCSSMGWDRHSICVNCQPYRKEEVRRRVQGAHNLCHVCGTLLLMFPITLILEIQTVLPVLPNRYWVDVTSSVCYSAGSQGPRVWRRLSSGCINCFCFTYTGPRRTMIRIKCYVWRRLLGFATRPFRCALWIGTFPRPDDVWCVHKKLRVSPYAESRKWGMYYVVGLVLKCYFRVRTYPQSLYFHSLTFCQVKRISLSKNVLRAIEANPDLPPLDQYPKAHQVHYFMLINYSQHLNARTLGHI